MSARGKISPVKLSWTLHYQPDGAAVDRCIVLANHITSSINGYMDMIRPPGSVIGKGKVIWTLAGSLTVVHDSNILGAIPFVLPTFDERQEHLARLHAENALRQWIDAMRIVFSSFGDRYEYASADAPLPQGIARTGRTKHALRAEAKRHVLVALIAYWERHGFSPSQRVLFDEANLLYRAAHPQLGEEADRKHEYLRTSLARLVQEGYVRQVQDPELLLDGYVRYNGPRMAYVPLYNADGVQIEIKREQNPETGIWHASFASATTPAT